MSEKKAINKNLELEDKNVFVNTGFRRFISEMYPKCAKTSVPNFISNLARDLEPVFQKNPLDRRLPEAKRSHLVVGRSSIKRAIFGTPPGYWNVSNFFKFNLTEADNLTQTMNYVVEKAKNGPDDIDLVYLPQEGFTVKDVFSSVIQSLESQGFIIENDLNNSVRLVKIGSKTTKPYDNYSVVVNYIQLGEPENNPVQIINLYFSQSGKSILKADLIKAPNEEELDNNFRLTGANSRLDLFSLGYLFKTKDDKLLLSYESLTDNVLDSPELIRHYYEADSGVFINNWYSKIRTMLQRPFWFNNFNINKYAWYGDYSLPVMLEQINKAWLDKRVISLEDWLNRLGDPQQLNKLKLRLPDIITDFLVGFSYDPFLFLKLIYETKLLTYLPISQLIRDPGDLLQVIGAMAEDFGGVDLGNLAYKTYKELFLQDPTNTLPFLSRLYQEKILNYASPAILKYSGPMILIKALNTLIMNRGGKPLPESLSTFEYLFNPLAFYESHLLSIPQPSLASLDN